MSDKLEELIKLKSRGAYVPPAKIRALMAEVELEPESEAYQKIQWENLRKKINSIVNKVNKDNIKIMVVQLFKLNLLRGRGPLCNSLIKSQQLSTVYSDVYASLVSVINSKIPEIGTLLLNRLIVRFKRMVRRENTEGCRAVVIFLSELVVFHVCSLTVIMDIIVQLLEKPNDFKVDMTITILNHCGVLLNDTESEWFDKVKNILRHVLNENIVDSKAQFLIQNFFDNFNMKIEEGETIDDSLDLVDEEDYVIHSIDITGKIQGEDRLDVFTYDDDYKMNNEKYNALKKEILGSDTESDGNDEGDDANDDKSIEEENSDFSSDNDDSDNDDYNDRGSDKEEDNETKLTVQIKDLTEQELTNFQKNVYLTIMSSMGPEEATHKLLKLPCIDPNRKEYMLADMVVKCCAQEKVYSKYYGLIGEILIVINKNWSTSFQNLFKENYENCYRYETALLRNIGAFWGHMLASDKLGWECLSIIKLTENDTTSSGRILIKFIFQKMQEEIGINHLLERIEEPYIQPFIEGIFPTSDAGNLRFSINFFTAIGLGKLTERMRESLENLPPDIEVIEEKHEERGRSKSRSTSPSSAYSSSRSRSYSRSRSRSISPNNESGNGSEKGGRKRNHDHVAENIDRQDKSFSRSRSTSPGRKRYKPNIPRGPKAQIQWDINRNSRNRNYYNNRNNYDSNYYHNNRSNYNESRTNKTNRYVYSSRSYNDRGFNRNKRYYQGYNENKLSNRGRGKGYDNDNERK